jgi:hypothetical protein
LEREHTTPVLVDPAVTPIGFVAGSSGDAEFGSGYSERIGDVSHLRADVRRLGMAADIDESGRTALVARVH